MKTQALPAVPGLWTCWLAIYAAGAIALAGCNKKEEDCRAVRSVNRDPVVQKADVDVADDKMAEKKAAQLDDFLKAASPVDEAVTKLAPEDPGVRAALSGYRDALATARGKATELKATFDEVAESTKALERRVALHKASERAMTTLLAYASSPDERTRIAARLDSFASRGADERLAASIGFIESMKPTPQTETAAKALKEEMADVKANGDLEKKFASLEKRSEGGRSGFSAARATLRQADSSLTGVCSATR